MKKVKLLLVFTFALTTYCWAQATYPFGTILKRVYEDESKKGTKIEENGKKWLGTLQPDGSWKDINYSATDITNWEPVTHIERLQSLVNAYNNPEGGLKDDKRLYQGIVKAFTYWYDKDPQSKNWWHNEISVPQKLGLTLILMRFGTEKLPHELEEKLIERMKRGNMETKTGANKTDIATHYFYRSLLVEDKDLLQKSLNELFLPVALVYKEEGLQHDYSYLQHGPQLYISGYGNVFVSGIVKVSKYVVGTPYALSEEKMQVFSTFYRDTYLKVFRSKYIDFNVEGRGVTRKGNLEKNSEKYRLGQMVNLDTKNAKELEDAKMRFDGSKTAEYEVKSFHKHFWNGDYTVHIRPEYTFNVRIASTRTNRSETGNGENLYGRYLSDGATNIQVRGPEYFDIMPVWEWDKIPGVTATDHKEDVKIDKSWGVLGNNEFAGGVSDGIYGTTAYQLDYDGVSAKKAWFFFDKEIVALGSDISANGPENITTTINQSWLNGSVKTSTNESLNKNAETKLSAGKSWVLHDGIGYYFPEQAAVEISTQEQKGSWHYINNSQPKDEITGNVFKMWINHGQSPKKSKYEYIVFPGVKGAKEIDTKSINILSNTETIQAVYHQNLKMMQVVFYAAGNVENNEMAIAVDKPCIVMVKNTKSGQDIYLADPLQKAETIKITVKDKKNGKDKNQEVKMPQDAYSGSSVKL